MLAERFDTVLGIDNSPEMLERARAGIRAANPNNVTLRLKAFESFKVAAAGPRICSRWCCTTRRHPADSSNTRIDCSTTSVTLVVVELIAHDQEWAKSACGDLWLGFDPVDLDDWAREVGLQPGASQYLAQRNGFRIQLRSYQKGAAQ